MRTTAILRGIAVAIPTALAMGYFSALEGEDPAVKKTSGRAGAAAVTTGEDWPWFLGPLGTGESRETDILDVWPPAGPPLLWEMEVGTGYSAPSIRGNRLVLHHRIDDEEIIECLRADNGDSIWKYGYETTFTDPFGYNNGPRCSPVLTADHCFTLGAEAKLTCVSLVSGERVWQRDLLAEFELPDWFFGVGCSPVLEEGMLIVLVGGQPNSGVVAFEAATGKTLWQSVGRDTWDGVQKEDGRIHKWKDDEMVVSYSSPIVATIHGQRHLLCLMRQGLVSLNPKNGTENFKYWFRPRAHESVNAARPLVFGDRIFISAAYRAGSALLQVAEDGTSYRLLWRSRTNMLNHWSTALYVDGFIYGFSGRHKSEGELRCLNAETGDVVWATTGFEGNLRDLRLDRTTGRIINTKTDQAVAPPHFGRGSKIRVGGKFIVLGEDGTLALVKINPEKFEELHRASYPQIHYPVWTAPILSRKRLYLRCEDALICLSLAKPKD